MIEHLGYADLLQAAHDKPLDPGEAKALLHWLQKRLVHDGEGDWPNRAIALICDGFYTLPHPGWPEEPDRTLFCRIDADGTHVRPGNAGDMMVPDYTTSLDAADRFFEKHMPAWIWVKDAYREPTVSLWKLEGKHGLIAGDHHPGGIRRTAPTTAMALVQAVVAALELGKGVL